MAGRFDGLGKWVKYSLLMVVSLLVLYVEVSSTGEVQCGGKDVHLNATQKQELMDCLAKFGVKSMLKLDSMDTPCFGQCLLTVRGFISQDGEQIEVERFMQHLDRVIADKKTRENLKSTISECVKQHGAKIKKDDKSCMSFVEIMGCVKDGFFDICVEDD